MEKGDESARVSASVGVRQRFQVELRPGETTIVSWKKLVKDSTKVKTPIPVPEAPSIANPALESRIAPGQPAENEANDAPPASRFSAVIEKIERLYMGKNSSDEEDLNDVPDDDEYDTEDSFIDDTELDEYFQVDNSAIKHDGFFVNRGKLERTSNDPTLPLNQQPKKRRRKDVSKDHGGSDGGHAPNKHLKVAKKAAGRSVALVEKISTSPSHIIAIPMQSEDVKSQNLTSASEYMSKKKSTDTKATLDPSPSRVSNGDAIAADGKDIDKQKTEPVQCKDQINKSKDGIASFDASHQRSNDKIIYDQFKSQYERITNNLEALDQSVQGREKNGTRQFSDINVPEGKNIKQTVKAPPLQKKEGSSAKQNNAMLEKALGELEKMVAQSRPPSMEVSGADILSQAAKKRMPPEIKQKLAKVAKLAQDGKISKELLLDRLMRIVGHLTQLSTLKRNLTVMVNKGLTAKREKDDLIQRLKLEVEEMVKSRVQALEKQAGASDDFQETGTDDKEALKRKCGMDAALEDKICRLYDVFIEGMEDDVGPQVRKLYAEVAELWPKGLMDKHGVRRAICNSKDRLREKYGRYKVQDKIKTKKTTSKEYQPQPHRLYVQALVADSANNSLTSGIRPAASSTTLISTAPRLSLTNSPNTDPPKQDKSDVKVKELLAKKKEKRKPESDLGEAQARPEKLTSAQGEEKHKAAHKQVAAAPQKTSLPLAAVAPATQLS